MSQETPSNPDVSSVDEERGLNIKHTISKGKNLSPRDVLPLSELSSDGSSIYDEKESTSNDDGSTQEIEKKELHENSFNEEEGYLHGTRLGMTLFALYFTMFLAALDQTIVATILSAVGDQFDSFSKVQWISSGYMLSTAVLAPSFGKIALVFGTKPTYLGGIVIFAAGSLICAVSKNMNMMIGGRVIAGIGGGCIQTISMGIMTTIVPPRALGKYQSAFGAIFASASVLGPVIGGLFTSKATWRWCYYLNLPISGVAFAIVTFSYKPERVKGSMKSKLKSIDYIGTFLFVSGVVLVLLAITWGGNGDFDWNSVAIILSFVLGGVLVILFFIYNFKFSKNSMLPPQILKIPAIFASSLAILFQMMAMMTSILYMAIYFQVVLRTSALMSGIRLLPIIIPTVISTMVSGLTISATGYTKPIGVTGGVIMLVGSGILLLIDENTSNGQLIGLMIPVGIGMGLLMQSIIISAQSAAPRENGGIFLTTSLLSFSRALGGVIGSAVGGLILDASFTANMKKLDLNIDVPATTLLNNFSSSKHLSEEDVKAIVHAFAQAFHHVMCSVLGFSGATFIFTLFLTNKRIPATKKKAVQPLTGDEDNINSHSKTTDDLKDQDNINSDSETTDDHKEYNEGSKIDGDNEGSTIEGDNEKQNN